MTDPETRRLATVQSLSAFGLGSEAIDAVTRLAAGLFDVPVSLVTLLDVEDQRFVAAYGTDMTGSKRSEAFCNHALFLPEGGTLSVPNALADPRFADSPLVRGEPHIRAYTGAPLRIDGQTVGTLCVLDTKVRQPLSEHQRDQLLALAKVTSDLMEKGRDVYLREEAQRALEEERLRLDMALKSADIAAWEYDPEAAVVFWHREGYRFFGLAEEEAARPQSFFDLIHPDDREATIDHITRVVAGTEPSYRATFRTRTPRSGYRWVVGAGEMHEAGGRRRLFGVNFDVSDERRIMDAREMAARELRHRIKNLIAVVSSIAAGTARGAADLEAFVPAFRGRLAALARGQDALLSEGSASMALYDLCRDALAPFASPDGTALTLETDGSAVAPRHAQTISMILHELATNAVKYGALGDDAGRVVLSARRADGRLLLTWRETHGRGCEERPSTGFGRSLIARTIAGAEGEVTYDWRPEGLLCEIALPI